MMPPKHDGSNDYMNEDDGDDGSDEENVNHLLSIDCPDVVHLFQTSTVGGWETLQKIGEYSVRLG